MHEPVSNSIVPLDATTIVTCIEAGGLEGQVLLLAESLRAFGGRWRALPFLAIKPRRGPALAKETRAALERLDVTFIDQPLNRTHAWWPHANKPAAMLYAEQNATTEYITWMDGDMLVAGEPLTLAPPCDYNFIAKPGEAFDVASNGNDDRAEYWERLCALVNLDFSQFPDIISHPDQVPIKAYWQTGIYTYPRSVKLAQTHASIMAKMLDGEVASKSAGIYHTDQVSAALAVQALGLRCAQYGASMNYNINPVGTVPTTEPLEDARIVHYHGALWPAHFEWAMTALAPLGEDQLNLIRKYAPLTAGSFKVRLGRKILAAIREQKVKALESRVIRY